MTVLIDVSIRVEGERHTTGAHNEQPDQGAAEFSIHRPNLSHSYRPFRSGTLGQEGRIAARCLDRGGHPEQHLVGPIPRHDARIPLRVYRTGSRRTRKIEV